MDIRDLELKGLLSAAEAREVVAMRDRFERARPEDRASLLRYILHELRVDRLCRLRSRKTKVNGGGGRKFVLSLYERLVRVHGSDPRTWIDYLALVKKRGHRKLASKLYARALQLHPTYPPLWIDAAEWQWSRSANERAVRRTLKHALQLLPENKDIWMATLKFELAVLGRDDDRGGPVTLEAAVPDGALARRMLMLLPASPQAALLLGHLKATDEANLLLPPSRHHHHHTMSAQKNDPIAALVVHTAASAALAALLPEAAEEPQENNNENAVATVRSSSHPAARAWTVGVFGRNCS